MNISKKQVHTDLHRLYKTNISAAEATRRLTDFYGKMVASERLARRWFKDFREGLRSAVRKHGSGRPVKISRRALSDRFRRNPEASTRKLAGNICSHPTAWRWLKKQGKRPKWQREIPHELTDDQSENRAAACYDLWKRNRRWKLPLNQIVTCDVSWVYYDGRVRRYQWLLPGQQPKAVPKRNRFGNKHFLCLCWCSSGPLY